MKFNNRNSKCGVYVIENLKNGKRYVGSTNNFRSRHTDHLKLLRGGVHYNKHLQNSWNKNNESDFEFKILAFCSYSNVRSLEQWYLDNESFEYNHTSVVVQKGVKLPNRKFDDIEIKKIRWLAKEGYLQTEIAELFDTNNNTLNSIIQKHSYCEIEGELHCPELTKKLRKRQTYHSTKFSEKQVTEIREQYKNGKGLSDLGREFNTTPQSINKIVKRMSYKNFN